MIKEIQIVVAADEPALFFSSVEAAERSLEPYDVNEGIYTAAYDRSGLPYSITVEGNRVRLTPETSAGNKQEELRQLLLYYLTYDGETPPADTSLESLLALCDPRARDY